VDSQSLKTTGVGGEDRGYDGGKKIKGRKRHLLVDAEGFVLKAKVHSAKVIDPEGIKSLLRQTGTQFPRLSHLWLDGGYRGEDKGKDWVEKTLGGSAELVEDEQRLRFLEGAVDPPLAEGLIGGGRAVSSGRWSRRPRRGRLAPGPSGRPRWPRRQR
jgi:putative transposase